MKPILYVCGLLLFTSQALAGGVYPAHKSISVYPNSFDVVTVSTTAAMQAYSGTSVTAVVTAADGTGGTFNYIASGLTADGGVVFTATGLGSGFWQRQYNPADGIKPSWWGDDCAAIQSAITYAGVNGKITFTPNKTYQQNAQLSPLAGQQWIGNGATLQRQTEVTTTINATVNSTATSFTVTAVPASWHVNDFIQIYITQSAVGASNIVKIAGISGNTITLSSAIGTALYNSATSYASGSGIYKVWDQVFDNINHINFEIDNLNFDGNSSTSAVNVYWGANHAINGSAPSIRIIGCTFINMGNDCIDGQGLYVTGCYYKNLNNSFIHLSTDFTISPATYPSEIFDNKGFTSNQVLSATGSQHSEGVITLSFTSGYCNIHDNWFSGALDAAMGTISMGAVSTNGGTRYMRFHHNQCFNLGGIVAGIDANASEIIKPGLVLIDGNTFSNCGTTAPFPATLNAAWAYMDKITWVNNDLSDGTSITIPAEIYSISSIANAKGTSNIQTNAAIDIDGNITNGGNLITTGTGTINGNVNIGGAQNSTISFRIGKNVTGGVSSYSLRNDPVILSGVTSSAFMDYSNPSTQAASFTLPFLYHYFLGGVTVGSGSTVTNQYGVFIQSTFNTATNNYGIFSKIAKASGNWFMYNTGGADSYMGGNIGFHQSTISAYAHFGAGTATAGTAPLKFTNGVILTTPEAGAEEYDGVTRYYTNGIPTRYAYVGSPSASPVMVLASTQTTLVTGTKALSITGVTTGSHAQVTLVSPSGASSTIQYQAVCTSGTVTIQANIAAGTINTADGSTLNLLVTN